MASDMFPAKYRTGNTDQVEFKEQTKIKFEGHTFIYNPGVYQSFNLNDKLPMKSEFCIDCYGDLHFRANTLAEVMYMFHQYCTQFGWTDPLEVTRVG